MVTAFMFIAAACGGGSVDDAAADGDPNEQQDTATVVGVNPDDCAAHRASRR